MRREQRPSVIVAGAGPAGSILATILARAGIGVTLVDRARFPRDKICGDAVGIDGVRVLRALGLVERCHAAGAVSITGMRLSAPSGREVVHSGEAPKERVGFVLPRLKLDQLLVEAAVESGANLIEGFSVKGPIQEEGAVVGLRGRHEGRAVELRAPLTVDAAGAHSPIARALRLRRKNPWGRAFAVRQYFEGAEGLHNSIELHYAADLLPAYGWIFPAGAGGLANVGVGIWGAEPGTYDLRARLHRFVAEHPYARRRLRRARPLGRSQGYPLDLGASAWITHGAGFLAVGDAASFVDPLTGEGIGTAMVSASIASGVIQEAIAKGDFSRRFLSRYERAWRGSLGTDFFGGIALQRLMARRWGVEGVVARAQRDPEIARILSALIAGAAPKWVAFSPLVLARLALGKRLPMPRRRRPS